jgi:hypothetical protein
LKWKILGICISSLAWKWKEMVLEWKWNGFELAFIISFHGFWVHIEPSSFASCCKP